MRPNILIFMTDQERGDVLDPTHPAITPHADQLAREGVQFRHCYTPAAHCCPSRASFMTGMYPSRHGIFNNVSTPTAINRGVNPGIEMFSEWLGEAGYRLVFTGKWHVSDIENPADRGWEELVITAPAGGQMRFTIEEWRNTPAEEPHPRRHGEIARPGWGNLQLFTTLSDNSTRGYEDHPDYPVIAAACDALPDLAAGEQPWVLYVGPLGPHDPFEVPQKFVDMYDLDDIPLPLSFGDELDDKPAIYQRMREQYWGQLSPDEVRDAIRHYWAYCSMEDAMFGQVLDALEQSGQADNTVVLRLSDHGEYCGDHGLFFKGVPAFREAYHIPAIMRMPGQVAAPGSIVDEFVTLADFAPTFAEIAGASTPDDLSGRSLMPFMRGQTPSGWRDAHYTQFNGVELYYSQRSVMTKDFKYVYNGFDNDELYDLRTDPHEMHNLANDPAYTDIKHELVRKMWRFAAQESDERLFNPYGTVAMAPWGPGDAL